MKIVVIAEKPKAAEKIAAALGRGRKYKLYGVPYWVIQNGSQVIIAPAAGHLYGLTTDKQGFPVFDYYWEELHKFDPTAKHTRKFLAMLKKVTRGAHLYVNACDYDIEGSVIGYMIIKNLGDLRRAKRMVFSALTASEIRKAWRNLKPLDWEMIEAGLARHELDWLWGINVSRALMRAYKKVTGKTISLSAGRVQSPTLRMAAEREKEIRLFVPLPYFTLTHYAIINGKLYELEPTLRFERKEEAMRNARRSGRVVDIKEEVRSYNPPPPFNLPDLQVEAARIYGFSPAKTQSIAEDLYRDALISYPRTNSQKLPKGLDVGGILSSLARFGYHPLVKALLKETKGVLRPHEGPKTDPAHPAIYPTGNPPKGLDKDHMKIYDLIVRRFLATFSTPMKVKVITVTIDAGFKLKLRGRRVLWKGWSLYYPFVDVEEVELPPLSIGDVVRLQPKVAQQSTRAPEALTKTSMVKWMERVGIGTEATRARIVEILFKRGYMTTKGGKARCTNLGLAVAEVLEKYFTEITSVELTRKFEREMELIREGKKRREEVVEEAKRILKTLMNKYIMHMDEAGLKLAIALGAVRPAKKCKLCNLEAEEEGLCKYHLEAKRRIVRNYKVWKERTGISWEEYLRKMSRSGGEWVKEVAKAMISGSL